MGFDYYYGYDKMMERFLPLMSVLMAVVLAVMIVGMIVKTVAHVIRSLALYTIGKRRGLRNVWLSWIPVGQVWIVGSLSDQYQYLTRGKIQNRRKILLILSLVSVVNGLISMVIGIAQAVQPIAMYSGSYAMEEVARLLMPLTGSALLGIVSAGVGITAYVFRQMSMYDVYRSADPKNAVPFLVFGILFGITEPIFLMVCRNKDEGMPPRKSVSEESREYDL